MRLFGRLARPGGLLVLALLTATGEAATERPTEPLVLRYEGNRLSVKPTAPVAYSDLESMLGVIGRSSLAGRYAMVLVRESPRELVGYVLVVEREGTLALGSQRHEWDPGGRSYRFRRGELYRSYQPLEGGGPWTWLVTIPVSRERQAALVIQAADLRWPVESVSISVGGQPTH